MADRELSSAGHKLGQLVGDWFEEHFVLPLLQKVADHLGLYLDHRFRVRAGRGSEKIHWQDEDGNAVDYDFVMELDGSDDKLGIPVAFFESFWRRGKRHSKDKARDDSGKLLPMREVYPTARFLGIVAGGDFTNPARLLVQSRQIDLFYVPKAKIVSAFEKHGLQIDYPDRLSEAKKAEIAGAFEGRITADLKRDVAGALQSLVGEPTLLGYVDRVRAALGALPQEIRFVAQRQSSPAVFETIADATAFLAAPKFDFAAVVENYIYEITYSDGTEFQRPVETFEDLCELHKQIERLTQHVTNLSKTRADRSPL